MVDKISRIYQLWGYLYTKESRYYVTNNNSKAFQVQGNKNHLGQYYKEVMFNEGQVEVMEVMNVGLQSIFSILDCQK
jgi:hypothetical protein